VAEACLLLGRPSEAASSIARPLSFWRSLWEQVTQTWLRPWTIWPPCM